MKNKEILKYIKERLLTYNFVLHEYKAYSTCSLYLKLDYGACNSIRISDHTGYEHLSYKYEVNQKFYKDGWHKDDKGFWRYHCQPNIESLEKLIQIIISDRAYKQCHNNYLLLLEQFKNDSVEKQKLDKGFWSHCRKVENINV